MKKLLIAMLLLIAYTSRATHIVGGDLTVQQVSGNSFQVTLLF